MLDESLAKRTEGPYLGPQPFGRAHQDLFFGRDSEANDLFSLVIAHSEVLLYSQSGAGKTSILSAGLITLLEKRGFRVFAPARVSGRLPEGVCREEIPNLCIFNLLVAWEQSKNYPRSPKMLAALTLREFLDSQEPEVKEPLASPTATTNPPTVIIVDQLEEIFEYTADRPHEREDFFKQIGIELERETRLRLVLAMREEYIAQLVPYTRLLPEQLKTRFRLERLREEAALLAIRKPLSKVQVPARSFAEGVAEELVGNLLRTTLKDAEGAIIELRGEFVEPVQLQVVCATLWRDLPEDVKVIGSNHLRKFGDVNEALASFYQDCIKRASEASGARIWQLRKWFGQILITSAWTRGTAHKEQSHAAGLPNKALDVLQNLHLIRLEMRAGSGWYELTHDRFIEPIKQSNERWLEKRGPAAKTQRRLEERAAEWARTEQTASGLLGEIDLIEAEQWLASEDASMLGASPKLKSFVIASRAEHNKKEIEDNQRIIHEQKQRIEVERLRTEAAKHKVGILIAAVVLIAVLGVVLWYRWRSTQALVLASEAADNLSKNPELSVPLALQAMSLRPNEPAVIDALYHVGVPPRRRLHTWTHPSAVWQVAFAPNGHLATACSDGLARIWEIGHPSVSPLWQSANPLAVKNSGGTIFVAFNGEGTRLASAEVSGSAKVWDTVTGKLVCELKERDRVAAVSPGPVYQVVFSGDGKYLATAHGDKLAKLWLASNCGYIRTFGNPGMGSDKVFGVALDSQGRRLATGHANGKVQIWDTLTGRTSTLYTHDNRVFSVAFSSSDRQLASSSLDGTARVWNFAASQARSFSGHSSGLGMVTFSPDERLLATASADGTAKLWDVESGKELLTLYGHTGGVYGVAFSPSGKLLATGSQDGTANLWSLAGNTELLAGEVQKIAFSSDSSLLASGGGGKIKLWSTASGEELTRSDGYFDLSELAFQGSSAVVTTTRDGNVSVLSIRLNPISKKLSFDPLALRTDLPSNGVKAWDAAFNQAKETLVIANSDGTGRLLNMSKERVGNVLLKSPADIPVLSVAFDAEGDHVATGNFDNTATIWGINGESCHVFKGHKGPVSRAVFSPDGKLLATASSDQTAIIWNTLNCNHINDKPVFKLPRQGSPISDVVFSRDRKYFATISGASVRIWNIDSKKLLFSLTSLDGQVQTAAFSPNGKYIAFAADGKIRVSPLKIEDLKRLACQHLGHNIAKECRGQVERSWWTSRGATGGRGRSDAH